jgi:type IV pilus assembly protein PilA
MICRYCSTQIPEGSQFCPKCGARLDVTPPQPASASIPSPSPPPLGAEPPTSGKAIGSLIAGIFFLFLPASIVAVILGHLSLSEIKKSAGHIKGKGLATAGLVLGYMGIAFIPVILIIAAIAIPNLIRARRAANEASAVGILRGYNVAMIRYADQCPQQGYPSSAEQLGPGSGDCNGANILDHNLASARAVKSGYVFVYRPSPADAEGHITSYEVTAQPVNEGSTGNRYFYTDQTDVIRFNQFDPAGPNSQPLE